MRGPPGDRQACREGDFAVASYESDAVAVTALRAGRASRHAGGGRGTGTGVGRFLDAHLLEILGGLALAALVLLILVSQVYPLKFPNPDLGWVVIIYALLAVDTAAPRIVLPTGTLGIGVLHHPGPNRHHTRHHPFLHQPVLPEPRWSLYVRSPSLCCPFLEDQHASCHRRSDHYPKPADGSQWRWLRCCCPGANRLGVAGRGGHRRSKPALITYLSV